MYYEEQIIQGELHFRTSPKGNWTKVESSYGRAVNILAGMSPEDRQDVLKFFREDCKKVS